MEKDFLFREAKIMFGWDIGGILTKRNAFDRKEKGSSAPFLEPWIPSSTGGWE